MKHPKPITAYCVMTPKLLDAAERSIELDKKLKSFEDTTLDGTPFESEPYIRGRDAGVDGTCIALEKILDTGEHAGTFGSKRLQKLADKLVNLKEQNRIMRGELEKILTVAKHTGLEIIEEIARNILEREAR